MNNSRESISNSRKNLTSITFVNKKVQIELFETISNRLSKYGNLYENIPRLDKFDYCKRYVNARHSIDSRLIYSRIVTRWKDRCPDLSPLVLSRVGSVKIEIRRCKLDTLMGSIRGSRTRWKKCTRAENTGYLK